MTDDLLLFYSPNGCSLGAVVVCEWLGEPYRLCRVEKQDHERPEYRALNPLGYSPLLRVGEHTFGENPAILHHLNARAVQGGGGFAQGTPDFDAMNHALSVLATGLHVAFTPFFHIERFADEPGSQANVKRVALATLKTKLAYVDQHITPPGFLFGRPTLIEAFLFGILRWTDALFDWQTEFPRLARCQARMAEEPAVAFALAREEQRDLKTTGQFLGALPLAELVASPARLNLKKEAQR